MSHFLHDWTPTFVAAAGVTALGVAGMMLTPLGTWYYALRKPSWQPPDWLFGPAWTIIFILEAASAVICWQTTRTASGAALLITTYVANGLFNMLWSLLFFTLRRPDWALYEVGFLWLSVVAMMLVLHHQAGLTWYISAPLSALGKLRVLPKLHYREIKRAVRGGCMKTVFPFTAIVGQDEMRDALVIAAIEPRLSGVLIFGDRGTGKSTAVRALAALLPDMAAVAGCAYACDPSDQASLCEACRNTTDRVTHRIPVPVVDLPLGATEDRVVGALNLERALADGAKIFEPGLLARAHRGFLYIDEVNLLEDHIVDLLLDVSASGENVVEREGMSLRHPARFVLIGSGNPEEGELRPQLLDRFGLCVDVQTPTEIPLRVEVVRRRDAFDRDPAKFCASYAAAQAELRNRILSARKKLPDVTVADEILTRAAEICIALGTDGLRGELTLLRAARAWAAYEGEDAVSMAHLRRMTEPSLRHRLRRDPLDDSLAGTRVARAVAEVFAT